MKKVILFDLGGVLINWNDDWLYDEISSQLKIPFSQIKSKFNENLCSLFESKITEKEFWNLVLGNNNNIDNKIISKTFLKKSSINYDLLSFAKSLKENGNTIGILSNLTAGTSNSFEKNHLSDFDYHFYSNSIKLSKPNPEIYQYVCDQIPSKNILLIDDKQENLDAAKLFGFKTILFSLSNFSKGLIHDKIYDFIK
ncbi:MAG: HAD-IA family hydrolase [Crenarchaeota archaeon]|nr:HAD-IA family hydrolase [Thermoproteota archaeon]MDA0853898.1 HAD-IA family hydrolase [Thermoproteota archaeon]MDA1123146.1 HAD-IA family hydrolase [Thermoproteota archaeon]HJJ21183.1 HAD-IA family hydrolase [Nitrosopumilus sp.]HJJ25891.1 HAD-IA family hydrolase [Nitrosopumilus sp.]